MQILSFYIHIFILALLNFFLNLDLNLYYFNYMSGSGSSILRIRIRKTASKESSQNLGIVAGERKRQQSRWWISV